MNEELINGLDHEREICRSEITVIGVGGAGGNAVNYMWSIGIRNVNFLICNTDQKALNESPIDVRICIGEDGLGAGNDPERGRDAAVESQETIREQLVRFNTKMLFVAAGMGGGTGTGAAPVVAKMAREMGILTVAIVTSPLIVEGPLRYDNAMKGIEALRECVDSLLIINNENIKNLYKDEPAFKAFSKSNEILSSAAKGISEIITVESSYVRVDFKDVARVMRDSGRAHISVARASGEDRAERVAVQSFNSPLLDHQNISGAKSIFLHLAVENSESLIFSEVEKVLEYVQGSARSLAADGSVHAANIIWGMSTKPGLGDDLELVLVATGFDDEQDEQDFAEYDRARLLRGSDPNSPFEGVNIGDHVATPTRKRLPPTHTATAGESEDVVVLPMRKRRYPNVELFLRSPAYLKRGVRLRSSDDQSATSRGGESGGEVTNIDGRLFDY
ncbi:MAG: cell division protein FtsZ [Rikenellaceae bacterium]